ncbi:hypothetical protein DNX69_24245 [Rhodopseudomonas palustris]|uniref:Uncharacterized protein n=1 Tax=Rhodopseudomonas palustris TaxID=1076 RepID=A0A323UCQ6_RHOPL|nr:hypothetical protein [Rhodopseudomonas palustris]PZA09220.1 hypothetical protein DNX69_24245 [Rhodopseudomonas palustris]
MRFMNHLTRAAIIVAWTATAPCSASAHDLRPGVTQTAVTYRGEQRWAWRSEDGETGTLRLGFAALPSGDYLVAGSLLLDDAELGASGSARWRGDRLIVDLMVSGGVRAQTPDAAKQQLFAKGAVPKQIDSAGFAMFRAELSTALDGITQQYQTNVLTGGKVQGPIYRNGTLKLLSQ